MVTVRALRPLLGKLGNAHGLRIILFTLDTRQLAYTLAKQACKL